ncbi:MAG: hypothetical protein AAGF26_17490, partial [Cyanobacteria bacterium P01_G01_bin.49]
MVQISLSTSTDYTGDLNALVEDLGNALTVRFDLDEPSPEGGLKVFVDSNVEQIVSRLDLPGFSFNPITENINPSLLGLKENPGKSRRLTICSTLLSTNTFKPPSGEGSSRSKR